LAAGDCAQVGSTFPTRIVCATGLMFVMKEKVE